MNFLVITGTNQQYFVHLDESELFRGTANWKVDGLTPLQKKELADWALNKSYSGDVAYVNSSTIVRVTGFNIRKVSSEPSYLTYRELLDKLKEMEERGDPRIDHDILALSSLTQTYCSVVADYCDDPHPIVLKVEL
jgi:hypothetical protein